MPRGAKPKIYPADLVARVAEQYAQGQTQHEIAAAERLTQKVVYNLMRRHGIKTRIAAKRNQWGENNHAWKGEGAGYQAMHRRLYARYGKPCRCGSCGTTESDNYDYANLSGRYEDMDDYLPMCRSCHWKYDQKVLNIKHMRRDANV